MLKFNPPIIFPENSKDFKVDLHPNIKFNSTSKIGMLIKEIAEKLSETLPYIEFWNKVMPSGISCFDDISNYEEWNQKIISWMDNYAQTIYNTCNQNETNTIEMIKRTFEP